MDRSHQVRNTVKTTVLLAGIGGLLVAVGSLVGGRTGAIVGLSLGLAVVGVSYWRSDRIALRSAGAVPVSATQAPQLHQMIDELADRAGIPKPSVHLIPSAQPNAFATGRNPSHAAVAVTQGLLDHCTLDEVRAVLAHEIGHIRHRDILIGSVAAAVATGISFLANMALWFGAFNGDDRDRPSPMVTLVVALVAPVAATVLQLALSRSREFEADRAGAELLGDPEPLARALGRLNEVSQHVPAEVSPTQASAYIVNPLTSRRVKVSKLFLTHPPVEDRIARLRALASEAR